MPLGQHALTAYALHLFLIPLAALVVQTLRPDGMMSAAENTGIQLIGVLTIWFIVVMRPRMAPTMSAFRGSVGLAAAAVSVGLAVGGAHVWAPASSGTDRTVDTLLVNDVFSSPTDAAGQRAGTGLGLPLALAIAQAHGGTIDVESALGQGSIRTERGLGYPFLRPA